MSGMRTSVTIQRESPSSKRSKKVLARSKVSTLKPSDSSSSRSKSRTASSSSMTTTLAVSATSLSARLGGRQVNVEDHAAARIVARKEPAAMGIDDRAADREADPQPGRLGGDEWLEEPVRQPRAGVGDRDLNRILPGLPCADDDLASPHAVQSVDTVTDQVRNHLVDLDLVEEHRRQSVPEHASRRDAFAFPPDQGKRARLFHDAIDVLERPVGLAFGNELAQASDDLPRPARLLYGLVEQAREAANSLPLAPLGQTARGLRVVDDRGEGLVELMRKGRSQPRPLR